MADNELGHKTCQAVRDLYDQHFPYWRKQREKIRKRREFLAGDRYELPTGKMQKDRRRIQIRGMETKDTTRNLAGELSARPRSIEAKPVDHVDDPAFADLAQSLVQWDLGQPHKCFDDRLDGCILDACQLALGIVWMDWKPKRGKYGDREYRRIAPDRVMWDEAYEDPHEPGCGFFLEEKRISVAEIHDTYPGSEWVKPDAEVRANVGTNRSGYPVFLNVSQDDYLPPTKDKKATLWLCWYKNDYSEVPDDSVAEVEGQPPTMKTAYPDGKHLVIIAPFQSLGMEKPVYDGAWPIPSARSFPGLFLTEYQEPGEPIGQCEVDQAWDQQIASDQLASMAVQRIFEHRTYWEIPIAGIENWQGERFGFRDDDYNIMYRNPTVAEDYNLQVNAHSGVGLDPQFNTAYGLVQGKLLQYRPKADFGLTPESTKDIAVGTVQELTKQASIPIEHFNKRKNRALTKFYGPVWDYLRATLSKEQATRLRIENVELLYSGIDGDDLPNFDFIIEDSPPFPAIDRFRAQAWDQAMALIDPANPRPQLLEGWARFHNVPDGVLKELERAFQEGQAAAPQAPPGGPMSGPTGVVQGGMEPPVEEVAAQPQV